MANRNFAMSDAAEAACTEEEQPLRPGRPVADLRDDMLQEDAQFRAAWDVLEVRRRIVTTLVKLRRDAKLTQKELARRAKWNPTFVSRLESFPPHGQKVSIPSIQTILTYAAACNSELGLVFGRPEGEHVHINETVALGKSDPFAKVVNALDDTDLSIDADILKVERGPV